MVVVSTPVVTVGWVCSVVVGSCALPKSTLVLESMGLEVDGWAGSDAGAFRASGSLEDLRGLESTSASSERPAAS